VVELDGSLLPSPFTPKGERPTGPAWYATPTVAYAQELRYEVHPTEAWVRREHAVTWTVVPAAARRLPRHDADLSVDADLSPEDFLVAMDGCKDRNPELAIVVSAVKATVKGGLGKLRERPREPWRALSRPTWRPDIRAAVISRTRINLHRKIVKHAAFTGQYPVAVLSDCVVYASNGESPLDFLPYGDGKPLPGGFKLGINPGLVKQHPRVGREDHSKGGHNINNHGPPPPRREIPSKARHLGEAPRVGGEDRNADLAMRSPAEARPRRRGGPRVVGVHMKVLTEVRRYVPIPRALGWLFRARRRSTLALRGGHPTHPDRRIPGRSHRPSSSLRTALGHHRVLRFRPRLAKHVPRA
jgi:hypothetical protein